MQNIKEKRKKSDLEKLKDYTQTCATGLILLEAGRFTIKEEDKLHIDSIKYFIFKIMQQAQKLGFDLNDNVEL